MDAGEEFLVVRYSALSFIVALIVSFQAHAASPVGRVGGAVVNAGETSVELRFGYTKDHESTSNDNRLRVRQSVDYGFNDVYAFRIVTAQDKLKGASMEHASVAVENRFQLIERRHAGWDAGVRITYQQSDGDKTPHKAGVRALTQVPFSSGWEWRHNSIIEHEVGAGAKGGLTFELRNQLNKRMEPFSPHIKKMNVGVELYNDFGRINDVSGYDVQDHQLGSIVKANFINDVFAQLGYRRGISKNANDHSFKFFLGRKF